MTFRGLLFTDQEACYTPEGAEIPCSGTGQDAACRASRPDGLNRFEVQGETVADLSTGLRWCRNANRFDFAYTWKEANGLVDEMNRSAAAGRHDWRLPSRRELFSILSHQHINPALPRAHPFVDVFPGYYWTATPCARLSEQVWYIHLGGARVYRGMKNGAGLVWPVAGPQWGEGLRGERFRIKRRIVHDGWTDLYWTRTARLGAAAVSWEAALSGAAALRSENFGGLRQWRLPNIRELESLVDLTRHSPALPADHPFEDVPEGCWSSTTSVYEPRYAWVLYWRDGAVGVGFKPQPSFGAWAVAGGGSLSG